MYCKATGESFHLSLAGGTNDAHLSVTSSFFKPTPPSKQSHGYKVTIRTAAASEGGMAPATDAAAATATPEVSITLLGSKAGSKPMRLNESVSTPGSLFQVGYESNHHRLSSTLLLLPLHALDV